MSVIDELKLQIVVDTKDASAKAEKAIEALQDLKAAVDNLDVQIVEA